MKKILFLSVMALVAAITLQSCSKDNDDEEKKEEAKVYTAGFAAFIEIEGELADYYSPQATITVENATTKKTETIDLKDNVAAYKGLATPCTFTCEITYKKLKDVDPEKEYDLSGTKDIEAVAYLNDEIWNGKKATTFPLASIIGSEIDDYMTNIMREKFSYTVAANGDITFKDLEE